MGVRLSEVAERAGVTASIASRVLNNKADVRVSEETRARILTIADELGYRPDPYAQVLQSGKSSTIILVSPQSYYLMNARRVTRLQSALHSIERPILTADLSAYGNPRAAADFLLFTRPTAVIWVSPDWSDEEFREVCAALHDRDTYMLAVDYARPVPPDVACDAVTVDRAHGCYLAVKHLIERAGERVALIGQETGGRLEGYRRALAEAGITDEMVVVQPEDPPQGAYLAAQTLLRERPDVQGVFCHSDLTAVGVIKALRDHGKRIPEDVAVVGFDNEPWTEFHQPSITTVSHPIEQLCSLSMSVLRSRLEGNAEPWCRIVLHPGLVIRQSTDGLA